MGKKKMVAAGIGALLLPCMLWGCSTGQTEGNVEPDSGIISEEETTDFDEYQEQGLSENEAALPEQGLSENETENEAALPEQEAAEDEASLRITRDDIVNEEEALENFWHIGYDSVRNVTVGEYVDGVPAELQEMLVGCHEAVEDMDVSDLMQQYGAQLEKITPENMDGVPIEDICNDLGAEHGFNIKTDSNGNVTGLNRSLTAIDIDGDGEDEYLTFLPNGARNTTLALLKNCEGEWVMAGSDVQPYGGGWYVLDYKGRYYILSAEGGLYWWKDEAAPQPEQFRNLDVYCFPNSCWNSIYASATETGYYTAYEVYSSDASAECMEDMDWATLTVDGAEEVELNKDEFRPTLDASRPLSMPRMGERKYYGNDEYIYMIVDSYYEGSWREAVDRGLVVLRRLEGEQWEIVKVYYLSADCDIQIQE